jgi:hypothetical protein
MHNRPPTDLQILSRIYNHYYETFASHLAESGRDSKNYVPINLAMIAQELGVDGDIVFGRLYYHLDKKFGYRKDDGSWVHLFSLQVGSQRHCVHFPLLASILADLQKEDRQYRWPQYISFASLAVSILAVAVAVFS